jgi:hypothetical protein
MAADVQGWFATPANNFGWILVGDESTSSTARVFNSREGSASVQPKLVISYNPVAPALNRRETWLRQYYPTPGTYVDDSADLDGDGITNLFEYAFAFSPLSANSSGAGMQAAVAAAGNTTTFTISFRRDPRATDLTYQMQTSDDLVLWSTITQSAAGAPPSGTGFVSESDAPGEAPVKNVAVSETLSGNTRRFARLRLIHVTQ